MSDKNLQPKGKKWPGKLAPPRIESPTLPEMKSTYTVCGPSQILVGPPLLRLFTTNQSIIHYGNKLLMIIKLFKTGKVFCES